MQKHKDTLVEECKGCARAGRILCKVIKEPGYFWDKYGYCFARVDHARAAEIEEEIKLAPSNTKPRKE
jgi:hypothetical protein